MRRNLLVAIICLTAPASFAAGELVLIQSGTWEVADGGTGSTYEFWNMTGWTDWAGANTAANEMGGQLVSLETMEENLWVFSNIALDDGNNTQGPWNGGTGPWLGGYEDNSAWYWLSGVAVDYDGWAPGEPNDEGPLGEDYMIYWNPWNDEGQWWNDFSGLSPSFIVEYAIPAPGALAILCLAGIATRRRR